jgi:hypothetical protein
VSGKDSEIEVPQLIRATGDRAVEQYRAFLDKPDWRAAGRLLSSKTPKVFN